MAIFRLMLMAAIPFVIAPFVSVEPDFMNNGAVALTAISSANNFQVDRSIKRNETIIYKTETAMPDFLSEAMKSEQYIKLFTPNYEMNVSGPRKYLEV
jgi:hypothetical protein